jgi:integrase
MPEFWQRERADGSRSGPYWTNLHGGRVTTGQPTLALARTWKAARLREGADPRLAAAKKAGLEDAVRELLAELRRRGRRPKTIEKVKKKLGHFARMWKGYRLASIDARLIDTYVEERLKDAGRAAGSTLSRTTIRDELAALRQLLKLARRQGLYPFHIEDVLPIQFETGHRPMTDFVPFDRLGDLLEKLPQHRRAHVLFFCVTGGRNADSFRARREDFDTSAWRITVRGSKTAKSWRTIPVPEFLRAYVESLLAMAPGEGLLFSPWSEGSQNRDIKGACRRAGLEPVSTNGLRRTFGHALRTHGYSLDVISSLFGHTTEALARDVYADFSTDELAAKVASEGRTKVVQSKAKRKTKAANVDK